MADDAARAARRGAARRRTVRRRRLTALAVVAGVVALVVVATGGGDGGGGPLIPRRLVKPAAELPRGGRSVLPEHRVVAYYGAPQSHELGALGIGTPDQA